MTLDQFCDRLCHLRVDKTGNVPKPYKPLLVAAVVLLIQKGKLATREVLLDGGLVSVFKQLLEAIYPRWPYKADPRYPFRHLENDGVWSLVPIEGASSELRAARDARAESWDILRHVRCAQLDAALFAELASRFDARVRVLQVLWETYFPADAALKVMRFVASEEQTVRPRPGPDSDGFTERALEEHLERHWEETPFRKMGITLSSRKMTGLPGRQVITPVNAIDLLGYRKREKEWWVFELKRGRPSDAVAGQVGRYLSWVGEEHRRRGETVRGAIIARQVDRKLRLSAAAMPEVSLWEFDDSLTVRQVG